MEDLRDCMFLWLLLLLSALRPASCGDGAAVLDVRGTVNGSVWLNCSVGDPQQVTGIYFQKKNGSGETEIFVNGFYPDKVESHIPLQYINRTSVLRFNLKMWNLTPSDEGDYRCIVFTPDNNKEHNTTEFHLTVTASYSVPTVTAERRGDRGDGPESWVLQCSSSGGYPPGNLTWTVLGEGPRLPLQEGVSESFSDKQSGLWTISQTATLNCTHPANVICSVGGAHSPPLSVCTPPPPEHTLKVIIASVLLFLFIIFVIALITKIGVCRRSQQPVAEQGTVEFGPLNHSPLLDQAG